MKYPHLTPEQYFLGAIILLYLGAGIAAVKTGDTRKAVSSFAAAVLTAGVAA